MELDMMADKVADMVAAYSKTKYWSEAEVYLTCVSSEALRVYFKMGLWHPSLNYL